MVQYMWRSQGTNYALAMHPPSAQLVPCDLPMHRAIFDAHLCVVRRQGHPGARLPIPQHLQARLYTKSLSQAHQSSTKRCRGFSSLVGHCLPRCLQLAAKPNCYGSSCELEKDSLCNCLHSIGVQWPSTLCTTMQVQKRQLAQLNPGIDTSS